jgi:DNA-binding MarR family transcriptional regulator
MAASHPKPAQPGLRFDSLEQEVFLSLWRTYDRLRALEDELFGRYDLTPQQYNVLRLLRAAQPDAMPTLALARRLVSHAPDITRMLDKLERRGLIVRERRANNRRVVLVGITEAGQTLLHDITEPLRACHSRQLGHLPAGDLQRLSELLRAARAPHEEPGTSWSHSPQPTKRSKPHDQPRNTPS